MAVKRTVDQAEKGTAPEGGGEDPRGVAGGDAAGLGEPRLEEWPAEKLKAHPLNMRTHPANQRAALDSVMARAGWAGAVIVNERTGHIIDGHLRAERAIELGESVPVLVFDLPEDREHLALATHDALGRWAEGDLDRYSDLAGEVAAAFDGLGDEVAGVMADVRAELAGDAERKRRAEVAAADGYWVSVECGSEAEQRRVFELMQAEGRACRVLTV
jgi:hypothetical protein